MFKKSSHKKSTRKKSPTLLIDIFLILILMAISILPRACPFNLSHIKEENRAEYMDDSGLIYMNDPDSYYYARLAREMAESHSYHLIIPSTEDAFRARFGDDVYISGTFFPAVAAFIFNLLSPIFHFSFEGFIAFIGPFLFSLSVIPAYIFVKRRTGSRFGAFVSGFFAGTMLSFLRRTVFCSFDTDILLFVLPLSYVTCFSEIFFANSTRSRTIFSALSVLFFLLLISTWGTYSIYFFLALGISVVYAILTFIKYRNKRSLLIDDGLKFSVFTLLACVLIAFILRGSFDTSIFDTIIGILSSESSASGAWPSPSRFVSELRSIPFVHSSPMTASTSGIINSVGGLIPFLSVLALLAFYAFELYRFYKKKSTILEETDLFAEFSVIFPWLVLGFGSLIGGSRFAELSSIPVSLALGLFVGHFSYVFRREPLSVRIPALVALCLAIMSSQIVALGHQKYTTALNDTIISASRFLGEDAGENRENSLVVSWWDYGYLFQYFGEQKTLADGGTYNGEIYCYLASIFLSSIPEDSEKALDYLLEKANLHPDTIYLIVSENMIASREALIYYADWISKDYNVYYQSSFLKKMYEEPGDIGDYEYLESFIDPLDRRTTHIYKYSP